MTTTDTSTKEEGARNLRRGFCVASLLILGLATAAQGEVTVEAGVEVLTRGPIHEAFAEASMTGASAGVVITKSPYDPISELPPDQRPEGDNIAWIPGYWSWDDDRSDFIWLSGVWRDIPPGRQWVPGYWAPVGDGSQWISGFWGDAAQTEVTYLPTPPEPLDVGPNSPAPGRDHSWTPGCWVWQQTRYDWQPGYWVLQQPDWVWSPAHYTWTPRGYIYVPGYWDHDIVHRGVIFAPVYYQQPVYRQPSYYHSPTIVIDLVVILASLFVQPRSHHYYFGDYYDSRYEDRGYYPWYSNQITRYGYDPMYAQFRSTQLRIDVDWDVHIDERYRYFRENVNARPPQTLALQVNFINNNTTNITQNIIIGKSLEDAVRSTTQPMRFKSVGMDERKQIETRGREVHKLQSERAKLEREPKAAGRSKEGGETAEPDRATLPVSPVVARKTENVKGAKTPPAAPVAPKPQAVEGRDRQGKPEKVEAKAETPVSEKKPVKADAKPVPAKEEPRKVEAKKETPSSQKPKPDVQARPEKTDAKPAPAKEDPRKVEAKKETPSSQRPKPDVQARPEKADAKPAPAKEDPRKVEAKKETPSSQRPKPDVQARPEKTEAKPSTTKERSQGAEADPKVRSPKSEPKVQDTRSDTKKKPSKRGQAPNTEDNKKKTRG